MLHLKPGVHLHEPDAVAAEAICYSGAGTVEFIVDASDGLRADRFWFMEMNTRLQVEHPVTEAITGLDLVEWQLRVASGEALPLQQEDLFIWGHAVEARLYAEDVPAGFLPATGRLTRLRFPEGVRIETGVREGDAITPWYDPMIAKLIAHGPTREAALGRLGRALAATQVAGCVTNLSFLSALLEQQEFRAGHPDTGLIERNLPSLTRANPPPPEVIAAAALEAAGPGQGALEGFHLWAPLTRRVDLLHGERAILALVTPFGPSESVVEIDGQRMRACRDGTGWVLGDWSPAEILTEPGRVTVFAGPQGTFAFQVPDPLDRATEASSADEVLSPMPGLVRAVLVEAGQEVARGDRLVVIEAMKMEHALAAPRDGRIAEVLAEEGAQVEAGLPLVRLEPRDG